MTSRVKLVSIIFIFFSMAVDHIHAADPVYCCDANWAYQPDKKLCYPAGFAPPGTKPRTANCDSSSGMICATDDEGYSKRGECIKNPVTVSCDKNNVNSCNDPKLKCDSVTGHCAFATNKNSSFASINICQGAPAACKVCIDAGNAWTALGCIKSTPSGFVTDFIKLAIGIAGGVALLMIVYGGFLITASAGEPKKADEGQEVITSAVAGLLFIIFSVVLLHFIGVQIFEIPEF